MSPRSCPTSSAARDARWRRSPASSAPCRCTSRMSGARSTTSSSGCWRRPRLRSTSSTSRRPRPSSGPRRSSTPRSPRASSAIRSLPRSAGSGSRRGSARRFRAWCAPASASITPGCCRATGAWSKPSPSGACSRSSAAPTPSASGSTCPSARCSSRRSRSSTAPGCGSSVPVSSIRSQVARAGPDSIPTATSS